MDDRCDPALLHSSVTLTGYDIPFTVVFQQSTDEPGESDAGPGTDLSGEEVRRFRPWVPILVGPVPEPVAVVPPRRERPRDPGPSPQEEGPRCST